MNAAIQTWLRWDALEHAFGRPVLHARFKDQPDDFQVDELLGFEPNGAGEHLMLHVEKRGLTTFEAQALLARHYGARLRDTAFAGMKDRQGVTRQWFSVPLATKAPIKSPPEHPQLRVLASARNGRKLRRGVHDGNRFRIVLREARGEHDAVMQRVQLLSAHGVPNYFGVQRFGRDEMNLPNALAWFRGEINPARPQRSLLLSAARSYLFNANLSGRVRDRIWNAAIDGDLMALAGSASTFASSRATEDELARRLNEFDLHVTGPLWGAGPPPVTGAALQRELRLMDQFPEFCASLAAHGLAQERRPLRARVEGFEARFVADTVVVEFSLARGVYATSVLRELIHPEST